MATRDIITALFARLPGFNDKSRLPAATLTSRQPVATLYLSTRSVVAEYFGEDFTVNNHDYVYTAIPL